MAVLAVSLWSDEDQLPVARDNAAAIRDFGRDPGPRIGSGVLFIDATYVLPPYSIERRGLNVLINDHLVYAGCEWPPFDPIVAEDPGDPPADSSPFDIRPGDHRQRYWNRKARYLMQHHDGVTACALMIEVLRRTGLFRDVVPSRGDVRDLGITVVMKDGDETGIDFWDGCGSQLITDPAIALRESVERQLELAMSLNAGAVLGLFGEAQIGQYGTPGRWTIPPRDAKAFLDILASPLRAIPRLDALLAKGFAHVGDSTNHEAFQHLIVDDALRSRMNLGDLTPRVDDLAVYSGFGSDTSGPITTGYVIVDNHYVSPPYSVTRQGLAIAINGQLIVDGSSRPEDVDDAHFDGHALEHEISPSPHRVRGGPNEDLRTANAAKDRCERALRAGRIVGVVRPGGEWSVDPAVQARLFRILLSTETGAGKVQRLVTEHILSSSQTTLIAALEHFECGGTGLYFRLGMQPPFIEGITVVTREEMEAAEHGNGSGESHVAVLSAGLLRPAVVAIISILGLVAGGFITWLLVPRRSP